ncbi:MAG TPA: hypothetical protein VFY44_02420 [Thermoleophilaceae bacterium]|nr:hypothetical protein [Thermoleophilaceae bacterium]
MKTTASIPVVAALGLLALAPPALAAPAKLSGGAVSATGATTVKVTNPNRYTLKGTVALASGKTKLASRKVSVKGKRSKKVSLKLSKAGLATLRSKGSLATTMTARLARRGGKAKSYRKALVLKAPGAAGGAPGSGAPGAGQGGSGGGATNRWKATTSMGGTFDLVVENGQVTLAAPTFQPVSCFKSGGYSSAQTSLSSEMFDKLGPWALGNQDATQTQVVPRVNTLVTSGERTVTYRLNTTRTGDQISGSMVQSFSDSRLEFAFPNPAKIAFISCAGTLNFTAVPAA